MASVFERPNIFIFVLSLCWKPEQRNTPYIYVHYIFMFISIDILFVHALLAMCIHKLLHFFS